MKVKAKELGYYGHKRRREGDVFVLESKDHFSKKWMVALDKNSFVPESDAHEEIEEAPVNDLQEDVL